MKTNFLISFKLQNRKFDVKEFKITKTKTFKKGNSLNICEFLLKYIL